MMDVRRTRTWLQSNRSISQEAQQLSVAALNSYEVFEEGTVASRADLAAIVDAARCRLLLAWQPGGKILARLAWTHPAAQEALRELASSPRNNERFQVITCLVPGIPRALVQDLLGHGLHDRSKRVRIRSAEKCDKLRLQEMVPVL